MLEEHARIAGAVDVCVIVAVGAALPVDGRHLLHHHRLSLMQHISTSGCSCVHAVEIGAVVSVCGALAAGVPAVAMLLAWQVSMPSTLVLTPAVLCFQCHTCHTRHELHVSCPCCTTGPEIMSKVAGE
jgi:hypothetical protein